MARYAGGDNLAFERLFALFAPRIRAFLLRSFSDGAVADDLMQTTFLKLHRARESYRSESPLKPWLYAIAAGVRRDELRRRYRLPLHVGEVELEQAESKSSSEAQHLICPVSQAGPHLFVFHFGGVALAAILGAGGAQLMPA